MSHKTFAAISVLVLATATACGPKGGGGGSAYVGNWQDSGDGAVYTFADRGKGVQMVGIVDTDGEVFQVRSSGFENGVMTWTYFVPSTSYVVTGVAMSVTDDRIEYQWSNVDPDGGQNAGNDVMYRLR